LFAAQALKLHGYNPAIISKKQKSVIYGAQYLHRPIPGLSSQAPTAEITTIRVGAPEVYAERVYGLGTIRTSWERVVPRSEAWDLRATYDRAWEEFGDDIIDWTVSPAELTEFTGQFDLVISTIPAWAICQRPSEHYFKSLNILVQKGVDLSSFVPDFIDEDSSWVMYNGTTQHAWYRASSIFGHTSIEARAEQHLVTNKSWEPGFKIVDTDCDCHPTIVKTGRMGLWKRGVLTHHAFEHTIEAISDQFGSVQPS
jgi:hypothetical protein